MSISWKVLAAAAAVTAVLSGCSSVSLDEGNKAGTLAGEQSAAQTTAVNPFLDPANPLYHRSVYFAFDSYEVSPEYAAVVEAHAKWLAANPEVKIVIQGNTDERGGREYNLALGQKRSEAVLHVCSCLVFPAAASRPFLLARKSPLHLVTAKKPGRKIAVPISCIRKAC